MTYEILLQTIPQGQHQATVLGWPELRAVGESETSALKQIWAVLQQQLAQSKVVRLDVETGAIHDSHPWATVIGIWKDDPTFDDFQEKMAAYRQEIDEGRHDPISA